MNKTQAIRLYVPCCRTISPRSCGHICVGEILHWAANKVWINETNNWLVDPTLVAAHCGGNTLWPQYVISHNKLKKESSLFQKQEDVFYMLIAGNSNILLDFNENWVFNLKVNWVRFPVIRFFCWLFCNFYKISLRSLLNFNLIAFQFDFRFSQFCHFPSNFFSISLSFSLNFSNFPTLFFQNQLNFLSELYFIPRL